MEEAVLRPTRRQSRSLLGILAVLTSVGLMWPAGIAAGGSSGASGAASANAPAAQANRAAPTVRGLGTRSIDAGRGHHPLKPLQPLNLNHNDRGSRTEAGLKAPIGVNAAPTPVNAGNSNVPLATQPFTPVEGLGQNDTVGLEPPDPWVAVGPNDVVQSVNDNLKFMNRGGTDTAGHITTFEFFDLANFEVNGTPIALDGTADPRWMYDVKHDRWLGEMLGWHCDAAGSTGFIFGAISLTGDPTGDYYNFYVLYEGYLPDYPMVGTSGDKFTISANEFLLPAVATNCTDTATFDAGSLTTFDWADMLTFPASPDFTYNFFDGSNTHFSLRPAVSPQGTSNTIFVVGEKDIANNTQSDVGYMTITGTNAANNVIVSAPIDLTTVGGGVVSRFIDPPAPVDPGGTLAAGIVDRRPTDAIWQDGDLTFVSTMPCPGTPAFACARVTELHTATATPTLHQDFVIPGAPAGSHTWFPGIGRSQSGILHVVYTQSSGTDGMSSLDRFQLPSDADNTLSDVLEIADGGTRTYDGARWGDYVGVAQDPRDTNAVWQANQYTKSPDQWGTRVSQLQTPGSRFVSITPVRVLDTRPGGTGLSGKFSSNVARTLQITGTGIPASAVAITGNLTVTDQNAAGFLAVTPTPTNTPSTSTLNFPLSDTRANNITSPLSTTGALGIVYRASTGGRTTNVILDVTGYYTNAATGATYHVVPPGRSLDTRPGGVGLSGKFVHGVVRSWLVRGSNGIPPGAEVTAVTGNLTVTGQNTNGLAAIGPAVTSNPTTSTLNIPLGDTRANGITVRLAANGTLSAVFRGTSASASAHLIFDVTGYYTEDTTGARFVPLTPGRRLDTRFAAPPAGLTGAFSANVARTLVIEPYQGAPGNATAITGNLTVVGQVRGGYLAMTPTATNAPTTSTLNFPVGDARANGVTGPLGGAGTNSVGLVYETLTNTGTTHVILDLTGYFR